MMKKAKVFLFTALASEAKPLVAHLKLKKNAQYHPFAIYSNELYCLTVTAIGKVAMATALAYTQALFINQADSALTLCKPILINIGIAGHSDLPLESIRLADKLIDADSGRVFYPPLVYTAPCLTTSITSVAKIDSRHRHDGLIDMEASAFYQSALNFTDAELIQCLKIVSDNAETSLAHIKPKYVSELMSSTIVTLESLIQDLLVLQHVQKPTVPQAYQTLLSQWHFTASEKNILLQSLRRHQILNGQILLDEFKSAKALLQWLQQENQKMALTMSLQ